MSKNSILKKLISLVILSVIFLQAFTSFRVYTYLPLAFPPASKLNLEKVRSPALWPFLTYPMYRSAYYEGDEFVEYRTYAVFRDSTEIRISPEDIGVGFWKYRSEFVTYLRKGEIENIQNFLHIIREKYEREPVRLRLERKPWVLQKNGIVQEKSEVIAGTRVSSSNSTK